MYIRFSHDSVKKKGEKDVLFQKTGSCSDIYRHREAEQTKNICG